MFVTQDITKGDWVHYSGHKGSERVLFPKYELTEEYRRASDGKTLHIIELSTLLQLFEADAQVVTAVAKAQEVQQEVAMRQEVIARLDSPQQVLVELFRSILDGTDEELPESIQALHRKIPDSKKMEVANLISNIVAREISKGVPSNEAHEYVANSIWEALLRKK